MTEPTEETANTWPSAEPQHAATEEPQAESVTPEEPTQVDSEPPQHVARAGERVTTPEGDNQGVEGVQAGGLTYVQNEDGTRDYPAQDKDVDVTVKTGA